MNVEIRPSAPHGTVAAPPSKSMAHRLLICAGLAQGTSAVRGIAPSEDVLATMDCLAALGAQLQVDGDTVTVRGADPAQAGPAELACRESGSTMRFFIPLCMLSDREMHLRGSRTLLERPLSVYESLAQEQGLLFERGEQDVRVAGRLSAGRFAFRGDISSQFASGLLFALPLAEGDSEICLKPPIESRAYIDMTIAAMREFGVEAAWRDAETIAVPGGQRYRARDSVVEGDWSNAAFLLALGAHVTGLDDESLQGDKVCVPYISQLDEGRAELDISDCPDLGPVLFAYAALRHGGAFSGTRRLSLKESDRGSAMQEELAKFGVDMRIEDNRIVVGCDARRPDTLLDGHNDHRIVMALSVLCARTGGTICGAEAVSKSFPDYFGRLQELGVDLEVI